MSEKPTLLKDSFTRLEGDVLADLDATGPGASLAAHTNAGGCFGLIPLVKICWEFIPPQTMRICLHVGDIVVCQEVSAGNCVTLEASAVLVKVRLTACLPWDGDRVCLTYRAELCVLNWSGGYDCIGRQGTIICIGPI